MSSLLDSPKTSKFIIIFFNSSYQFFQGEYLVVHKSGFNSATIIFKFITHKIIYKTYLLLLLDSVE